MFQVERAVTAVTICNKIRQTGEWPTLWTQSLVVTIQKKDNLQQWQNYWMISLISHPSEVMLKILLKRLKQQAENIITAEQVCFRAGRSTTQQIFNQRILCEKHPQHQQDLYHVFVDFKKAFNMVWYASLWATTKKVKQCKPKMWVTKRLYDKATKAVLFNGSVEDWFQTTAGVCHSLSHPLQHVSGNHDRCLRRVHNNTAELVQTGGEIIITTLMTICNKIWQTGEWPTLWTQS